MGSGKGNPEYFVAVVKPGRILFEVAGLGEATSKEALKKAMHKLPIKCKIVSKAEYITNPAIAREKELKELKQELFKLRFQHALNGLDNPKKMSLVKKNIARVNTAITMKKGN